MTGEMAGRGLYARQILRGSGFIVAILSGVLVGTVAVWVDPEGNTILTNREEPPVPGAVPVGIEERSGNWRGEPSSVPGTREHDSSLPEDRLARERHDQEPEEEHPRGNHDGSADVAAAIVAAGVTREKRRLGRKA